MAARTVASDRNAATVRNVSVTRTAAQDRMNVLIEYIRDPRDARPITDPSTSKFIEDV